jgi:bifunctional enzyme CysN/CysC
LPNMTGINSPYEAPEQPALKLDTSDLDIEMTVKHLMALLLNNR